MNRIIQVLIVVLLLGSIGMQVYFRITDKSGWIDLSKTYSGFNLKKDLEKKLMQFGETRKRQLDSLEFELSLLARKARTNDKDKTNYLNFRNGFLQEKQRFEMQVQEVKSNYDSQVMKQMNSLVRKYGKENHYKFIYGMDDSGILIHGEESEEITTQVIEYLNKEYEGHVE